MPNPADENYYNDDEAKSWRCESCSMKNAQSTKRCASCGVSQHGASMARRIASAVDARNDIYDRDSQLDEGTQMYDRSSYKGKGQF